MQINFDHRLPFFFRLAALAGLGVVLVSCSGGGSSSPVDDGPQQIIAMSEGEGALALEKKFTIQKGDIEQDEHGALTGNKRSPYEGKRQVQFGGEWQGKSYEKKQYEKSSWWGSKKKDVKTYAGGEDASRFRKDSRYASQSARQEGKRSGYDGQSARGGNYRTTSARESVVSGVSRPSDAKVDWRRDAYPKPRIMGYKDYQKHSIEQTRSLLGRDD